MSITTLKQHVTNRHQCGHFASINKRKFCSQHFPVKMKTHKKTRIFGPLQGLTNTEQDFYTNQTLNETSGIASYSPDRPASKACNRGDKEKGLLGQTHEENL